MSPRERLFGYAFWVRRLEEFELEWGRRGRFFLGAVADDELAKLFVGDCEDGDHPFRWDHFSDALDVDGGVFARGAVAEVDGELEHRKAVEEEAFSELRGVFSLAFGFSGEVEEDE